MVLSKAAVVAQRPPLVLKQGIPANATGRRPRSRKRRNRPIYQQLSPIRNASPEAVAAHQKARLHGAMIEACARHGYADTKVRELTELAGVSCKCLYDHFAGLEGCFLATYDQVVEEAVARISAAYSEGVEGPQDRRAGLCRAFAAFVLELVERPEASRVALVEILQVGPSAAARIEHVEGIFASMIGTSLRDSPEHFLPPVLVRGIVAGIWFVSRRRFLDGHAVEISGHADELLDWLIAYRGCQAPRPSAKAPPTASTKTGRLLDRLPDNPHSRILVAAADIAARRGFRSLSQGMIVDRADAGPEDFSEFADPAHCFFSALDHMVVQALNRALRSHLPAQDWGVGVCRTIRSLLTQLAEDQASAHALFAVPGQAGAWGVRWRATVIESFARLLARRAPADFRPPDIVAEGMIAATWTIVERIVRAGRTRDLPVLASSLSYLILAPTIGADLARLTIEKELGC